MVDKKYGLGMTLEDIYKNTKPDESAASYPLQAADKIFSETQKLKEEKEELTKQSFIDSLTGLLNQNAFEDAKKKFDPKRQKDHLIVFMFDLNGLKKTNDNYSHEVGDQLIINMAKVLNTSFRISDRVFRTGGDEFVAFCKSDSDPKLTKDVIIERLKENTTKTNQDNNNPTALSFALGVAEYDKEKHKNLQGVITEADIDMYRNKAAMKAEQSSSESKV